MATLPLGDRQRIWRGLMRYWSRLGGESIPGAITKAEFQAAVDATDSWIDSNAASMNSALPATFRTNASAAQKALLFAIVALARHSPALCKNIIGETD